MRLKLAEIKEEVSVMLRDKNSDFHIKRLSSSEMDKIVRRRYHSQRHHMTP